MVETSAVQISINVVDNTSGQVLGGVEQKLNQVGAAGASSGTKVRAGMNDMGAGALSAHEKVRLLTEEFGVRIPRAMQSVISKSPAVMGAIGAIGGAMIGLGAIQIGAMVFTALIHGAEKLWDALTQLPKAVRDYEEEVAKAKTEDFGNTHSIETTRLRIDEATEAVKKYTAEMQQAQNGNTLGWRSAFGYAGFEWQRSHAVGEASKPLVDAQRNLDKLQHQREAEQAHEQRLSDLDLKYAGKVGLSGKTKRDATVAEATDRAHEERFYGNEQDRILGNPVAPNAGADKEAREVAIARIKADAELANQQKTHAGSEKSDARELARIHEEAIESGLRGSDLYHQREAAAIEDLKQRGITSAQAVADVHTRFHNEELRHLEDEGRETDRIVRQASLAGLTGTARTRGEGANRVADINADPNLDPANRAARVAAAQKETNAQVQREDQEAAQRKAEQARTAADETAHIEEAARVRSLSAEKQKTASIQAEYDERLQHYQQELDEQKISQEDFNRRAVAAEQEKNAEMVEASTEARKKMAGEFTSFFKGMEDPKKYLKELGDKAAGNAAAGLWQHFQQRAQGGADGQPTGAKGFLGSLIFGKKQSTEEKMEHAGAHGSNTVAHSSISVASAVIHVGSASISGGGAGAPGAGAGGNTTAGGAGVPGGFAGGGSTADGSIYGSGGSTSLLAPGVGGGSGGFGGGSTADGGAGAGGGAETPGSGSGVSSKISGGVGMAKQGYGLGKQIGAKFASGGKGAGDDGDDGNAGGSGSGSSTAGAGGTGSGGGGGKGMAQAGSTAQGAIGVYAAHEGSGGAGGAMKGAASGAEMGAAFGPIGMAVGAVAGAVIGYLGSGGKAKEYDEKTVRPRIANTTDAFHNGSMDYLAAYSDMESLQSEAFKATSAMGPSGRRYRNDHITPEIKEAEGKFTKEEKAGRSQYSESKASYAVGTDYVPETGPALLHQGEMIVPADQAEQVRQARGTASGPSGKMPVQSQSMGDIHLHLHAIDAKSSMRFLQDNKHHIRAALNDSFAENSGGGMN
jgi:hypothetical protein